MMRGAEYIQGQTKRNLDITLSLAVALASLPVSALVAAETNIEHGTVNPFFVNKRIGKGGQEFGLLKFRSMKDDARLDSWLGGPPNPRASQIGRIIRSFGLDELPQMINVVKGDLSFVGIRPVEPHLKRAYRELVDDEALYEEWD